MSLSQIISNNKKILGTNFVVIGPNTSPSAVGEYNKESGELIFDKNIILADEHSFTSNVSRLTPSKKIKSSMLYML